jgi:hypothetical protein
LFLDQENFSILSLIRANTYFRRFAMDQHTQSDVWIYRICIVMLGLVVLVSLGGSILLSIQERVIPEALVALGSAAVGSLAGLLAPSPIHRR